VYTVFLAYGFQFNLLMASSLIRQKLITLVKVSVYTVFLIL
jgi:hypothetical protein